MDQKDKVVVRLIFVSGVAGSLIGFYNYQLHRRLLTVEEKVYNIVELLDKEFNKKAGAKFEDDKDTYDE